MTTIDEMSTKSHIPASKAGELPTDKNDIFATLPPQAKADLRRAQDAFYDAVFELTKIMSIAEVLPTVASGHEDKNKRCEQLEKQLRDVYRRAEVGNTHAEADVQAIIETARENARMLTRDTVEDLRKTAPAHEESTNGTSHRRGTSRSNGVPGR